MLSMQIPTCEPGARFFCCWNADDWQIPRCLCQVRCALDKPGGASVRSGPWYLATCEPSTGTVLVLHKDGQVRIMKNGFNANFSYCQRCL